MIDLIREGEYFSSVNNLKKVHEIGSLAACLGYTLYLMLHPPSSMWALFFQGWNIAETRPTAKRGKHNKKKFWPCFSHISAFEEFVIWEKLRRKTGWIMAKKSSILVDCLPNILSGSNPLSFSHCIQVRFGSKYSKLFFSFNNTL